MRRAARDTLCSVLWPDSADEQARASLRQALSALRKSMGEAEGALVADGETVGLDS